MHPYKVSVLQQLYPNDLPARINYCNWFNANINNDDILDKTFFTDEAWFNLTGYINSQNYRTWSTENPHEYIETSLHPEKIGVWIAISRRRIIGPIFFNETVTGEVYRNRILNNFFEQVHDDELTEGYFMHDGAPAHTAHETIRYLEEFYPDRLISRGIWAPRSPDLTPPDFFLFGHLKNTIYRNRIHNLDQLKNLITDAIEEINVRTLINVFESLKRRINICIENNGAHFEHLL